MSSIYRVIDDSGRMRIPKTFLETCNLKAGDIVKVSSANNTIIIYKVGVVDSTSSSPEETMNIALNAMNALNKDNQIELLKRFAENLKKE